MRCGWSWASRACSGLNVPEEYGGAGVGDSRFALVLAEELSKLAFAYSSCVGIHADCVAPYLVDLGTEEQKQRWLPGVLLRRADHRHRDDRALRRLRSGRLKTTAVRDGDGWILNGSKTFITNGYSADLVIVAARTSPGEGGPGHHAVRRRGRACPASSAAASWTRSVSRSPTPPSCSSPTSGCRPTNVIGEVDRGFIYMMERLVAERIGAAVSNIAHARQILDETIAYVKERHGLRPADRLVPGQQAHAGRAGHPVRGHPGLRRRLRHAAGRRAP